MSGLERKKGAPLTRGPGVSGTSHVAGGKPLRKSKDMMRVLCTFEGGSQPSGDRDGPNGGGKEWGEESPEEGNLGKTGSKRRGMRLYHAKGEKLWGSKGKCAREGGRSLVRTNTNAREKKKKNG